MTAPTDVQREINGLSDDAQEYVFDLEQAITEAIKALDPVKDLDRQVRVGIAIMRAALDGVPAR